MANKYLLFNFCILSILITFSFEYDINNLIEYFKSFLQKNISNKDLLNIIKIIRNLPSQTYPENLKQNVENFPKHLNSIKYNNGFIENQNAYYDMKYGIKTIADSGCEIIALYNAIYDLTGEVNIDFPLMIDYFEKDGIILYGAFGTDPQAIEEYLNKSGFKTISSTEIEDYPKIEEASDSFILIKYNNEDDIMDMIHSICISKKNGKFYAHNSGSYIQQYYGYDSISDLLAHYGKAKPIYLIGIQKQ